MKETSLWHTVKRNMTGYSVLLQRHEDLYGVGIPDISYSVPNGHGWIELKSLKIYPKNEETSIRIPSFTNEQRHWLYEHGKLGGRCFLFLQIERDYYLFEWGAVWQIGQLPKLDLAKLAIQTWHNYCNWSQFYVRISA